MGTVSSTTLSPLRVVPSARKGKAASVVNAPTISTLPTPQLRVPMEAAPGRGLIGSPWCSKWCYTVKQSLPQEVIPDLTFNILWIRFCFHLLPKSSQCHFFSSQLTIRLSHHFAVSVKLLNSLLFQLSFFFFSLPSHQHFPTAQAVHTFKHRIVWLFSSSFLV